MADKHEPDPMALVWDVARFVTSGLVDTAILVVLIVVVIPLLLARKALTGTGALPGPRIITAMLAGGD